MATKTIDTVLARAILSEVASGGWLDQELPEDEEELMNLATYYVNEAEQWIEDGNPEEEHIIAIINLSKGAQVSPPVLSETAENTNDGVPPGEIEQGIRNWIEDKSPMKIPEDDFRAGKGKELLDKVAETYPRRSSGGYSESDLREHVELPTSSHIQYAGADDPIVSESNWAAGAGLPVPKNVSESDPHDMPTDLTEVGDKPLRRLYSAFNAYSGRARWMLAIAQSNLANATHLKDAAYRTSYRNADRLFKLQDERATKDLVDNEAREDEDYKSWEEKVLKHEKEVVHWRALSDIYNKNVEIISREWTMRVSEYERER